MQIADDLICVYTTIEKQTDNYNVVFHNIISPRCKIPAMRNIRNAKYPQCEIATMRIVECERV